MNQIGLYALFSILIFRYCFKSNERFYRNFILGLFLPNLLNSFSAIVSLFIPSSTFSVDNYNATFSHSIFVGLFIFLIFYLISNLKKNYHYKTLGNALFLGFLFHVLCDMVFWLDSLYIFWPITDSDLKINLLNLILHINLEDQKIWTSLRFVLEFFFLRFYIQLLIEILIINNSEAQTIQIASLYQKIQLNLFFLFLILFFVFYYMNIDNLNLLFILFNIVYFPSLLYTLFITYKSKVDFSR